jgi:hypothetical protein
MQLAEIANARRITEHELGNVLAVQQAQKQAEPLMAMVEKNEEAVRNKKAVDHSVELLRQASIEHNRTIDHIRKLEQFIDKLIKKIPEDDRPVVPKLEEEKPEPKPKKWS